MNSMKNMNSMNKKKDKIICGSVKVSSRGQVVIPLEVRKKLDIKEGEILFVAENGSRIELVKSNILKKALDNVK